MRFDVVLSDLRKDWQFLVIFFQSKKPYFLDLSISFSSQFSWDIPMLVCQKAIEKTTRYSYWILLCFIFMSVIGSGCLIYGDRLLPDFFFLGQSFLFSWLLAGEYSENIPILKKKKNWSKIINFGS